MRELVGAGHVAAGKNIRVDRFQIFVGLNHFICGNAQLFQAIAGGVGDASDGAENLIEGDAFFLTFVFDDEKFFAVLDHDLFGFVIHQYADTLGFKLRFDDRRHFYVFANHDARQHLDLRNLRAEAREALREFRADRPAAQHHQAFRQFANIPDVVRGEGFAFGQPRNRRHERPGPGGNDDILGRQFLFGAVVQRDFDFPR